MESKYLIKFEDFVYSVKTLSKAKDQDLNNEFILTGITGKFNITFEKSWKCMKDILNFLGVNNFKTGSPRDILKRACSAELISDKKMVRYARR